MADHGDRAEASLSFILTCLHSNRDPLNIDFHDAARSTGMTQARNCQQKFKKLIESTGKYTLTNSKVVEKDGREGNGTPATPVRRGSAKPSTPRVTSGRKRKSQLLDENDSGVEDSPAKKRVSTAKRGGTKGVAKKFNAGEDDTPETGEEEADGNGDYTTDSGEGAV